MVMAWILQSLGGSESTGVYVKDTKGGIKSFIKNYNNSCYFSWYYVYFSVCCCYRTRGT